ncbi:protein adenylyltransferase SelO family protein [Chelatococcus reniformis]|uniref:Selenoprotein O n=1 Tax=Chelatococcus reniformis TaxID=1494448 RepID=A0A916XJJ7_9HYPH|nr:hypothetical protein GCM10010994_38060 [Chelatococcus reniformis]
MTGSTAAKHSGTLVEVAAPVVDNSDARPPQRFFAYPGASAVSAAKLIRINRLLASEVGLNADWLESSDGIAMLADKSFPVGAEPIALAYAGHQFGNFVPQLGDGRGVAGR